MFICILRLSFQLHLSCLVKLFLLNMEYSHFEPLPLCSENSYLPDYIISESIVPTWLHCLTLCLMSNTCRSVNVWENPGYTRDVTCQLNWSSVDQCVSLQLVAGVKYYTMRFASCGDIQRLLPLAADGEYSLDLGTGRIAKVYCHNLNTSYPLVSPTSVKTFKI